MHIIIKDQNLHFYCFDSCLHTLLYGGMNHAYGKLCSYYGYIITVCIYLPSCSHG